MRTRKEIRRFYSQKTVPECVMTSTTHRLASSLLCRVQFRSNDHNDKAQISMLEFMIGLHRCQCVRAAFVRFVPFLNFTVLVQSIYWLLAMCG